jgi:dephospho-CoA kinase
MKIVNKDIKRQDSIVSRRSKVRTRRFQNPKKLSKLELLSHLSVRRLRQRAGEAAPPVPAKLDGGTNAIPWRPSDVSERC